MGSISENIKSMSDDVVRLSELRIEANHELLKTENDILINQIKQNIAKIPVTEKEIKCKEYAIKLLQNLGESI
jgi:DNA polymerase sigma